MKHFSLRTRLIGIVVALVTITCLLVSVETVFLTKAIDFISDLNKMASSSRWLTLANISSSRLSRQLLSLYIDYEPGKPPLGDTADAAEKELSNLGLLLEKSRKEAGGQVDQEIFVERIDSIYKRVVPAFTQTLNDMKAGTQTRAEIWNELQGVVAGLDDFNEQLMLGLLEVSVKSDENVAVTEKFDRVLDYGTAAAAIAILIITYLSTLLTVRIVKEVQNASTKIKSAASTISEATGAIAHRSESLTLRAEQQVVAITGSASELAEFNTVIHRLAQVIRHSASEVTEARARAAQGRDSLVSLARATTDAQEIQGDVAEIERTFLDIQDKTKIINEIVFKTQMLAFNAEIEAALAGRHGLGFSVIAKQIGQLADSSGRAAEIISKLLDKNLEHITRMHDLVQKRLNLVQESASRCEKSFNEIYELIGTIAPKMKEVEATSLNQLDGIAAVQASHSRIQAAAAENQTSAAQVYELAPRLSREISEMHSCMENLESLLEGRDKQA